MALSIKTYDADRLAREIAAETHETLTEAVTVALRERLDRLRGAHARDFDARVRRLQVEYARHPVTDPRTDDEIIGYDEHGLPS